MSTPSKELIAAAHVSFPTNEAALKQLATMFGRIAIPYLGAALGFTQFITSEFARNRARLAEIGTLFEPDTQKLKSSAADDFKNAMSFLFNDSNEILKPFGVTVEEMIAARQDEVKSAQVKQKLAQPMPAYEESMRDPQKLIEAERRLTVNAARLFALQVRNAEGLDAYATIPSGDNTLDHDDQRPEQHDVMKITLVVPVPDEQVAWDDILQYRQDPDSQNRFVELKEWISDVARGSLTPREVGEKLEMVLDRYRKLMENHQMQMNWSRLEAYAVSTAEVLRDLGASLPRSTLFSVEGRKLALLEGESTSPGSVVAFVIQAKSMLAS